MTDFATAKAAAEEAARKAIEGVADGGSCNLDSVRVVVAGEELDLCFGDGQAARRTLACEAACDSLKAHGYDARMHYVID